MEKNLESGKARVVAGLKDWMLRGAVDVLSDYVWVRRVGLVLLFALLYCLVGLSDCLVLKACCIVSFPVVLFVEMCRWGRLRPVPTRLCLGIACVGGIYALALENPSILNGFSWWIIGFVLLWVFVESILRKKLWIAIFTALLILMGNPVVMGYDPYILTDARIIGKSLEYYEASEGQYVFSVLNEAGEIRHGLRDRRGEILPAEYETFLNLDRKGRFIGVLRPADSTSGYIRHGIYDIRTRRFILDPTKVMVTKMSPTGNLEYALYDEDSQHFSTLLLPGRHPERMEIIGEARFIPEFYDVLGRVSLTADYTVPGMGEDDSQGGMNAGAKRLMNIERQRVMNDFLLIARKDSDYGLVYATWDNLLKAMIEQLVTVTYGEPYYSMQPLQYCGDVREWYEAMRPMADADREALEVDYNYHSPRSDMDEGSYALTKEEIAFFTPYRRMADGGYNLMWNKVLPAYESWLRERAFYSSSLAPDVRKDFDASTATQRIFLFDQIRSLARTRNDNILCP